ncbi:hypothetical protein [Prosthecochloris vibrioformis]|uniref:hypothetical protein n=1 Tax=Prosthecochloris vibrioformis TaxID=1098 RepID=UPI0014774239|nr:hypothetical protein [Prosthecochloris vibrioformis]
MLFIEDRIRRAGQRNDSVGGADGADRELFMKNIYNLLLLIPGEVKVALPAPNM